MKKMIYPLVAILVIGILLVLVYMFGFRQIVAIDKVAMQSIEVTDQVINIKADFTGSSMGYAGYKMDYQDGKLYVKILMRNGLQFGELKSPSIFIPNNFKDLKKIYLEGHSPTDTRLIWSK